MSFNVHDLKISETHRDRVLAARSAVAASVIDSDTAGVVNGQAVGFLAGLTELNKNDVMESSLFSQLVASQNYDRFTQTEDWYMEYKKTLEILGWLVTDFQFNEHTLSNVEVSVDTITRTFLKSYLNESQLKLMDRVIAALEDETNPAAEVFTTSTAEDKSANFQLGTCSVDADGNVAFSIGAFVYTTNQRITNALFHKVKRGTSHFKNGFQKMTLNESVYKQIRQAVHDKLGNNLDLIKPLPLAPPNSK